MSEENFKTEDTQTPDTVERISKADVEDNGLEQQLEFNGKKKPKKYTVNTLDGGVITVSSKPKKFKLSVGETIFFIFDYLFFIVFTLACIFPFYYLLINTISDSTLVDKGMIYFIPRGINFKNIAALKSVDALGQSVIITLLRTVLGTSLMVAASGFVGYLVTKEELWGRKFFYRAIVITMYFNAGLIPWYLNTQMLGLTDTFAAYIIPGIVAPYNIILVKTYIESIPLELQESAYIDGASHMKVFTSIVWPLSMPILATIAIFGAVGNWNSFQDSLILMHDKTDLFTLQHRLYIYLTQSSDLDRVIGSGNNSTTVDVVQSSKIIKYTISIVSTVPILLVYPFMMRYFEEGIMLGAVKG